MVSPVREYPDEGGFNIKSRSPGSLQSRNTKNLSIQIDDSSTPKLTMLKTYPKSSSPPSPKENQSSISAQKSPLLAKRLSEAQIYTLSGALRSTSSCPVSYTHLDVYKRQVHRDSEQPNPWAPPSHTMNRSWLFFLFFFLFSLVVVTPVCLRLTEGVCYPAYGREWHQRI